MPLYIQQARFAICPFELTHAAVETVCASHVPLLIGVRDAFCHSAATFDISEHKIKGPDNPTCEDYLFVKSAEVNRSD